MPLPPGAHAMTPLEIATTSIQGLIDQGGPAWSSTRCLYRTPEGRKCVVSQLIADEDYIPQMEYHNIDELIHMRFLGAIINFPPYFRGHIELLRDLQDLHDKHAETAYAEADDEETQTKSSDQIFFETFLPDARETLMKYHNLTLSLDLSPLPKEWNIQ